MRIEDLRDHPHFVPVVADRIWNAWWREAGVPLEELTDLVRDALGSGVVPSTLVAHEDGQFIGTASLIAHDMDARPQYSPWLAALWVEPEHRKSGVGAQLVAAIAKLASGAGHSPLYLYCRPALTSYYEKLGWTLFEKGVEESDILIFPANPA